VRELIDNDRVTDLDRIRLVLLFVLRFEGSAQPQVNTLVDMLKHRHVDDKYIAVCYVAQPGLRRKLLCCADMHFVYSVASSYNVGAVLTALCSAHDAQNVVRHTSQERQWSVS
jgi:hypothetical protein